MRSTALLSAFWLLAACAKPSAPSPGSVEPLDWVRRDGYAAMWDVWADVRAFVGDETWEAAGFDWIEERARADLAAAQADWSHAGPYVVSGVHRLGLAPDAWPAVLLAHEPGDVEDGGLRERLPPHWRARFARWAGVHPDRAAVAVDAAWQRAIDTGDLTLLAACAELARGDVPGADPAAWDGWDPSTWRPNEVRDVAHEMLRLHGARWVERRRFDAVLDLLEAYGVPRGVDLDALLDAARARRDELESATIPLPQPFDAQLFVLRFERLANGR